MHAHNTIVDTAKIISYVLYRYAHIFSYDDGTIPVCRIRDPLQLAG